MKTRARATTVIAKSYKLFLGNACRVQHIPSIAYYITESHKKGKYEESKIVFKKDKNLTLERSEIILTFSLII
jgi:hypothetical protein